MTDSKACKTISALVWMPLLLAPLPGLAAPASDFVAEFDFIRNGKLAGKATFSLENEDEGRWVMRSDMEGTKGLARFLGVEERSVSRGVWNDGKPRPLEFEQTIEVAFKTIRNRADFDWEKGIVKSVYEEGETTLELAPGVVDGTSVGLAIRAGLNSGETEWRLPMLDEDEIEEQHFKARPAERIDTELGCLEVRNVEKIRAPESKRYTRTYYATEHDHVPVLVQHGKRGDESLETRIVALTIDGESVEPGSGCQGV